MALILLAGILFAFLLIGAVVFVICAAISPWRRFALPAALWCAVWGPCLSAWMLLGGIALAADGFALQHGRGFVLGTPGRRSWWIALAVVATTAIPMATFVSWVHQLVIHRMTFQLFRLYTTGVVSGIGSVLGISLSWWLIATQMRYLLLGAAVLICLVGLFGFLGFRFAKELRGQPPEKFSLVTVAEFYGKPE